MIIVGTEQYPSKGRWEDFQKQEDPKVKSPFVTDFDDDDFGGPESDLEEVNDSADESFAVEDDFKPMPGKMAEQRASERQPNLSEHLHAFLKSEWRRLEVDLQGKLGEMELSEATKTQLKTQIGIARGSDEQGDARLASVFKVPEGASDDMAPAPGNYQAQPMPFEEAADKLSAGQFSSMSEMAWVIYNAGGHKAGGGYTSADSEKKLSTRPAFSGDTERARQMYVEEADKPAKTVDLRHIISSTTLNKALASSNDALPEVNDFLKRHGRDGEHTDILPAKVEVFDMVHSHLGNLWPGGAADNQAAGTMHGKLNFDARTENARMPKPDGAGPAQPAKPSKKQLPPINGDQHVSDCQVNHFLTKLGKLDDDLGKIVQDDRLANKEVNFKDVSECAKLIGELNDRIRGKVGAVEGGYTVEAMETDLNEWLAENGAQAGDSLQAKVVAALRDVCLNEVDSLQQLKNNNPANAKARVDKCELTGHIEKLRARGEVSQGEKEFLEKMNVSPEDAVLKKRQVSQKEMVDACVDYLQARSVTCDKLRDDASGKKGYTQKDLVGDLENLAANFDFDLADSLLDHQKIKATSPDYMTKLIDVELALLEAKAGTGVSLFAKREKGKLSVMDQFMDLDYKLSEKVEAALGMEDDAAEVVEVASQDPRFKRERGDGRTHDEIRENKAVSKTTAVDRPDPSKKQKLSNSAGAGEEDPMKIAFGLPHNAPAELSSPDTVGKHGKLNKCEVNPIKSLADMKQKKAADKKAQGTEKMKISKPG
ncbi:hypothetical protein [Brevifollis gellanilyticus]|uniref:Uncharacterized protein n=1 Tax=Brevifollis gellanilyticus TaxID=748831 RepID=A0A512MB82_9BACT|nr:hypothetical protein [Brevifollis gellanilyticus]GEP43992.1 hypothetical protein BGE01nite_32830 [Brevifollis gellanilyticus]